MGISFNKQKLMHNILTPSIIAINSYGLMEAVGIYICPWLPKG